MNNGRLKPEIVRRAGDCIDAHVAHVADHGDPFNLVVLKHFEQLSFAVRVHEVFDDDQLVPKIAHILVQLRAVGAWNKKRCIRG
ncbi:hypothetical protein D3C84_1193580 [compost metagenome]